MPQKWKRVAKAAQISCNKFSKFVKVPYQNFHLITSKRYSKERKFIQKVCEAFPDADIKLHLTSLRNDIPPDRKHLLFSIIVCKTIFNDKLYYRSITITYYTMVKEALVSFKTVKHLSIHSFRYKSVGDFNKIAKDVIENIGNIEFTAATNY